jgi:hypothetical protein
MPVYILGYALWPFAHCTHERALRQIACLPRFQRAKGITQDFLRPLI